MLSEDLWAWQPKNLGKTLTLETNCKTNLFLFSSFQPCLTRNKDWPKIPSKTRVALLWLSAWNQTNTKLTESSSRHTAYSSFLHVYYLGQIVFNGSFSSVHENTKSNLGFSLLLYYTKLKSGTQVPMVSVFLCSNEMFWNPTFFSSFFFFCFCFWLKKPQTQNYGMDIM